MASRGVDDTANDSSTKLACTRAVLQSVTTLQRACSAERSEGMLVALGAQITISEFVAGRTAHRLESACKWLEDWCRKAEPGACSPSSLGAYGVLRPIALTRWLVVTQKSFCVPCVSYRFVPWLLRHSL